MMVKLLCVAGAMLTVLTTVGTAAPDPRVSLVDRQRREFDELLD